MRQYALKDKLIALGWSENKIITIDQDLGKSGANAQDRDGFQSLVADVSNNLVGAIACLECSRLSRSSTDWGRLTQFCAYTRTLLIDADGVYDPNDFNDRLLLGLKGTMSEAELHFLQERMRGGLMNKAKRGELKRPIPIGYLYADDSVVKDPDREIQGAVARFFESFRKTGSAHGVAQLFKTKGYKFPYRVGHGFRKGDIEWLELACSRALEILHNPFYAGVYSYGEMQTVWTPNGKKQRRMPREDWHVFIKNHHPAYISYDEFEANERTIEENSTCRAESRERTPPREGSALIQGMVICGKCGSCMTVRYTHRNGQRIPHYVCQKGAVEHCGDVCQVIHGVAIDDKITELLLSRLTPEAIAASIQVQKELDNRQAESMNYYQMRVEKCQYEVQLARRRFMNVDPDNRLVALELESNWNAKLKCLDDAQSEYNEQLRKSELDKRDRDYSATDNLAVDFPKLFASSETNHKDKKRMVRYLIEDVTLNKVGKDVQVHILYKGRTTESVTVSTPPRSYEQWTTDPKVIEVIDSSAGALTTEEICTLLNRQGYRSGKGYPFAPNIVKNIMYTYAIPSKRERYIDRGYVSCSAKAAEMGITSQELMRKIRTGTFDGEFVKVNAKNECVFPPDT